MRRKRRNKQNKIIPSIMISLCTLIAIYMGMTIYFKNHFDFGSKINGINVAGMTVEEAEKKLSGEIERYTLDLEERGDVTEQIKAADIGLKYDSDKIRELKENQNPYAWVSDIFRKSDSEVSEIVTYDEALLNKCFNNLSCIDNSDKTNPKSASLKYTEDGYGIVDEVYGNKIDKDALYDRIVKAILKIEPKISLDASDCYEKPKYTSKSQEVADAQNILNKYTNLTITYTSGEKTEALDGSTIHNWLEVDENMKVIFNEDKVMNYVNKVSSIYNTFGNTRDFATTSKTTIKVSGGNYGWIVDKSKEVKDLIETVKKGQDVTKEPIFSQTAIVRGANDIGNTYVEIDMTKQHLWFYKNGSLITEGDVVTGNLINNTLTPAGTYVLNYKEKNATLKGEDYSSPVNYWMPFNGNIGIHDASWRTEFGKDIYMTNGSHGCVNAPYEIAKTIFNNIESGTPIVCYYE